MNNLTVINTNNLIASNTGYVVNNCTVNALLASVQAAPKSYFVNPNAPYACAGNNFEVHFESNHKGFCFITSLKAPTCSYLNVQIHNGNQKALFVSQKHKVYIIAQLQLIYNSVVW